MWPSGYSVADVTKALTASQRKWSFRYELMDEWYQPKGEIKVIKCSVDYNALATGPNRTAKFQIPSEEAGRINFYMDQIRAWARLKMPDGGYAEFPVGTFDVTTTGNRYIPKRRWSGGVSVSASEKDVLQIEGYDGIIRLQQASLATRQEVNGGYVYTDAIRESIGYVNLIFTAIEHDPRTLPVDVEWAPGTSFLKQMTDLTDAINYEPLHIDSMGTATSRPYKAPEDASVLYSYAVDRKSVIIPGIDVELDLFNIPNVFIASVSEPDRLPLRSVFRNDDPNSVLSTVSRGRDITLVLDPGQGETNSAPDQASLDALVARAAQEASQQYEVVEFTTGLMPMHEHADVCMIDYGEGPLRYRETSWSMDLVAGGQMKHSMRRVVVL